MCCLMPLIWLCCRRESLNSNLKHCSSMPPDKNDGEARASVLCWSRMAPRWPHAKKGRLEVALLCPITSRKGHGVVLGAFIRLIELKTWMPKMKTKTKARGSQEIAPPPPAKKWNVLSILLNGQGQVNFLCKRCAISSQKNWASRKWNMFVEYVCHFNSNHPDKTKEGEKQPGGRSCFPKKRPPDPLYGRGINETGVIQRYPELSSWSTDEDMTWWITKMRWAVMPDR